MPRRLYGIWHYNTYKTFYIKWQKWKMYEWLKVNQCYPTYIAVKIYIQGHVIMLNKTFQLSYTSSLFTEMNEWMNDWINVASKLFQILTMRFQKILFNIYTTVQYKQLTLVRVVSFGLTRKNLGQSRSIHQIENYFISANKILIESLQLETSKACHCNNDVDN